MITDRGEVGEETLVYVCVEEVLSKTHSLIISILQEMPILRVRVKLLYDITKKVDFDLRNKISSAVCANSCF